MFAKIIVGVISSLFLFVFLGTIIYFIGPKVWAYGVDAEVAMCELPQVRQQLADLQASDKKAADSAQQRCDARVQSAQHSAAAIGRLAAPRARVNGAQPYLSAADLGSVLQ